MENCYIFCKTETTMILYYEIVARIKWNTQDI